MLAYPLSKCKQKGGTLQMPNTPIGQNVQTDLPMQQILI